MSRPCSRATAAALLPGRNSNSSRLASNALTGGVPSTGNWSRSGFVAGFRGCSTTSTSHPRGMRSRAGRARVRHQRRDQFRLPPLGGGLSQRMAFVQRRPPRGTTLGSGREARDGSPVAARFAEMLRPTALNAQPDGGGVRASPALRQMPEFTPAATDSSPFSCSRKPSVSMRTRSSMTGRNEPFVRCA